MRMLIISGWLAEPVPGSHGSVGLSSWWYNQDSDGFSNGIVRGSRALVL